MIEVETTQRDGETVYNVHGLIYGQPYPMTEQQARELAKKLWQAMEQETKECANTQKS